MDKGFNFCSNMNYNLLEGFKDTPRETQQLQRIRWQLKPGVRPGRHLAGVKILKIIRHPIKPPCKDISKGQLIYNIGANTRNRLGQCDSALNGPGNGNTAEHTGLEYHTVNGIPHFLVYVISLTVHIDPAFHLPNILEEIPQPRRKLGIIAVIHGDTDLIQKNHRIRLRLKFFKGSYINNPDTGNPNILHISIDMPSLFLKFKHKADHRAGLPCPLLAKDKG